MKPICLQIFVCLKEFRKNLGYSHYWFHIILGKTKEVSDFDNLFFLTEIKRKWAKWLQFTYWNNSKSQGFVMWKFVLCKTCTSFFLQIVTVVSKPFVYATPMHPSGNCSNKNELNAKGKYINFIPCRGNGNETYCCKGIWSKSYFLIFWAFYHSVCLLSTTVNVMILPWYLEKEYFLTKYVKLFRTSYHLLHQWVILHKWLVLFCYIGLSRVDVNLCSILKWLFLIILQSQYKN